MPDIPSTTKGEQTFVNPQLDGTITGPKDRQKLTDSFQSFWDQEDAKGAPPAAPSNEDPKETKEPEKEVPEVPKDPVETPKEQEPEKQDTKEDEPEKKPEQTPEPKEVKPATDKPDDLDKFEPHPAANEESKSHFKALKEAAKTLRDRNKAWENLTPVLRELGFQDTDNPEELAKATKEAVEKIRASKTVAVPAETQAELERLRGLARSVGVLKSEEFTKDYVQPVERAYLDVIHEMSKYFPADEETVKKDFLDPLQKFRPPDLPVEWWDTQVEAMTKATPSVKAKIQQKIASVLNLQERHDIRAKELSENGESYAQWQQKMQEEATRAYQASVRDEVEKVRREKKEISDLMPLPLDGVTDPEKIESINKHNAYFQEKEKEFREFLTDVGTGPRTATRRALELIVSKETIKQLNSSISKMESELAAAKKSKEESLKASQEEIEKLRKEVTLKRKVADAPMKPEAGTGAKPAPTKTKPPVDGRKTLAQAFDDWKL